MSEYSKSPYVIFDNENLNNILKLFIQVKVSENRSPATVDFYEREILDFISWLSTKYQIQYIRNVDAKTIRAHLFDLSSKRNKGGIHAR